MTEEMEDDQKLGVREIAGSLLAAATGVQSLEKQRRDFQNGSLRTYVLAGITVTVLFIITVVGVVHWVLATR